MGLSRPLAVGEEVDVTAGPAQRSIERRASLSAGVGNLMVPVTEDCQPGRTPLAAGATVRRERLHKHLSVFHVSEACVNTDCELKLQLVSEDVILCLKDVS